MSQSLESYLLSRFYEFKTKEDCLAWVHRGTWDDKEAAICYVESTFDSWKSMLKTAHDFSESMANHPKPTGKPYMKDRIKNLTRKK